MPSLHQLLLKEGCIPQKPYFFPLQNLYLSANQEGLSLTVIVITCIMTRIRKGLPVIFIVSCIQHFHISHKYTLFAPKMLHKCCFLFLLGQLDAQIYN